MQSSPTPECAAHAQVHAPAGVLTLIPWDMTSAGTSKRFRGLLIIVLATAISVLGGTSMATEGP